MGRLVDVTRSLLSGDYALKADRRFTVKAGDFFLGIAEKAEEQHRRIAELEADNAQLERVLVLTQQALQDLATGWAECRGERR